MAKVLQFSEMVPETYPQQSRDFQLFCALLDISFNSDKYLIDGELYINYPELCPNQYLKLLANKVGFDYNCVVYDDELRKIIKSFNRLVQYKGSEKGIRESIKLFMNIKHLYFDYSIEIRDDEILIFIYEKRIDDLSVLSEILKYILPCGYIFKYYFVSKAQVNDSTFTTSNYAEITVLNVINNTSHSIYQPGGVKLSDNKIIETDDAGLNKVKTDIINDFNTMMVVSSEDIKKFEKSENEHNAIRFDGQSS